MQSHTGYDIDENYIRDVIALHERFGVELPSAYERHFPSVQ